MRYNSLFHLLISNLSNLVFVFVRHAPNLWNELPDEVHPLCASPLSFREKLKAYLITKAFPSLVLLYSLIVSVVLTPGTRKN